MSKVKKGKRVVAAAMAVALSVATVTTGVVPSSGVFVRAAEDENTYTKVADSSVDGFYYEQNGYGDVQCTTDKTLEYSSYDETISKLAEITRKIIQENAYESYSFDFSIKIDSDQKDTRLEGKEVDKDLENEIYKETGDPKGGHTMAAMGGGLTHLKVTYSESEKAYIGKVTGTGGYGAKKDRYNQAINKLDKIIENLNLDGKSDYDKFKAITYWIVSNVKYDSHYNGEPNTPAGTKYPHDMTGPVLDEYAVCDGYAGLFYYMANAVGLKTLYEDGSSNSNGKGHAWDLVQIDEIYYYTDPTNAYFKSDGEPGSELLYGQKYFFTLYTPDSGTIEDNNKNISQDDYLKDHSVCKGNHNLYESGGKVAQCETPATTRYRCSNSGCLYTYEVEKSPALGHAWDEGKVTQEQSCDKPEITTYTCTRSNCKKTKQVETKPSLGGHTWDSGKITKEATCIETGVKTYTCNVCGDTKTEAIPKTSHEYEEQVIKAPTCTAKGISKFVCKNCGFTTGTRQTPATGHIHTEIRNKKDATYTDTGYTGDTYCSDCGIKLSSGETIPKLVETEHDYGDWIITNEPTCKKYGSKYRKCKLCGNIEFETIEKVDHTWELTSTTPATCGIGEIQHYKCSVCGETKDVTLDNPLSHVWDNGKVTKKPTCTETGIKTFTCKNCGTTKEETIEATGHLHKETRNQKAATCEEAGYTGDVYCSDCGTKLESGTAIKATGHTWDNGVITKEATETEEGVKTYTCKICGETKTEAIPVKSHNWDQGTITKKATCTENGEKTYHCTDTGCDKTYVETIPATGHQHTEIKDKKDAKCEENGYTGDTYCKDCGQLINKGAVIKATGHQHTEVRDEKKATCTEQGYSGDTYCTDCGELIKKGSVTEKADHNWKVTNEEKATCEKDGSKTFTCTECGETKTETTPKTGHKFGSWQTVTQQTVFTNGVQKRICSICGKEETRNVDNKLKATIKTNASSLRLKKKQSTSKFIVTDLAKGDYIKSWTSSNKKLITITGNKTGTCKIKAANKTGKAKITIALASGLKKTMNVTVQKNAVACTSIKNVPKKLTLNYKKSYQLKPVINPITCTSKAKYKTSNKKVVKVASNGKITAVKKGKAKITVTVGKKKVVCNIIVK